MSGAYPTVVMPSSSPDGGWVVVCEARTDTDGDGELVTHVETHHGSLYGDDAVPYLIVGHGEGEPIDGYVTHDPTGR